MTSTNRVGRWSLYIATILMVLVVALRLGVGIYLSSSAGKEMVARQLSKLIGLPVEVDSVQLGFRQSSVSMRVLDPNLSSARGELLEIEKATVDISCLDLLLGQGTPGTVDLEGVTLHLRLDKDGKVSSALPKAGENESEATALPHVKLTRGLVVVQQTDRPEFSVKIQDLNITPQVNGEVSLTGNIDDPQWAKWRVKGYFNSSSMGLDLSTEDGPLTVEALSSIPFVPASIWSHIKPNGRGAATVHFSKKSDRGLEYAVSIKPASATLTVPVANTTLANITGSISVAGTRVEFQGVKTTLAGGTLSVDGGVEFGSEPTSATLKVAARGLNLQQLPDEWELPKDIEGELQGNANLTLLIQPDGKVETQGGGSGTIEKARIRGIPVAISMRLVTNGKRYRFENPDSPTKPAPQKGPQSFHHNYSTFVLYSTQAQAKAREEAKADETPTNLTANVKLRNVEIAELLDKLKVNLGYKINGKISAEVAMNVPLARVAKEAAYEFTGKLTSPALQLEGLVIRDLSATVVYHAGKLTLTELIGKINQPDKKTSAGTFRGTALVEREPPGDVKLNFSFERIPLGEILKAIPDWSLDVGGLIAGKAEFKTPYAKLSDSAAWTASAELNAPDLVFAGRKITGLKVGLEVKNGSAALKDTKVNIEGIPVTAEATLALKDHFAYSATVRTTGTEVTNLRKLIPEVELPEIEGLLEISANLKGTAAPLAFQADGQITASRLTLAKNPANNLNIKWQLTPNKLVISSLHAAVFGGNVSGSADVPFGGGQMGKFELGFKNLNARDATAFVPDFPIQLTGAVSGKVTGKIAAPQPGRSRVSNLDLELTAPQLTVQGIPADQLSGKASIDNGVLNYQLEGKTLGGSFEVKGRYPGPKSQQPVPVPKTDRGSFKLTGVDLSRVAPALKLRSLSPLRGKVDVNFEYDNDLSAGSGRVVMAGLGWGDTTIARELIGILLLQGGELRLAELNGRLAGGDLRAKGQIQLNDVNRNHISLSLHSADSRRLLAVLPDFAEQIDGPISVNLRAHIGREIRGSGTVAMSRGTILGVAVADLRVPFDWSMVSGGSGRLSIREATANTGTGRAEGKMTLSWGFETRLDGSVQFLNAPIRSISPELGSLSLFGNGRITGRFVVSGVDVRSVNDMTGTLVATLNQASVKEIPFFQQTIPFLNAAGLAQPFQTGEVRGTLKQGVFRVQKLALSNPGAQVFAEGTITLAGRIDAAVVAHTGIQNPLLRLLSAKLPPIGPIPLTLIQEVSQFLANRTIRLSISGTTKNPIVRVNAAALLSEEAVRFFLARYILPSSTADVLGLGLESGMMGK